MKQEIKLKSYFESPFSLIFTEEFGANQQAVKNMFWLYEDYHLGTEAVHWDFLSDELPESRAKHCQLQINDCEVAFIGGERGDLQNTIIDIWNFKERTWRTKE